MGGCLDWCSENGWKMAMCYLGACHQAIYNCYYLVDVERIQKVHIPLTETLLKPHLFDALAISIIGTPKRIPRASLLWGTTLSKWAIIAWVERINYTFFYKNGRTGVQSVWWLSGSLHVNRSLYYLSRKNIKSWTTIFVGIAFSNNSIKNVNTMKLWYV